MIEDQGEGRQQLNKLGYQRGKHLADLFDFSDKGIGVCRLLNWPLQTECQCGS